MYLGIEAQIPAEEELMENGNIEFYIESPSSVNVFAAFGDMTPAYTLPHAVIINQINNMTGTNNVESRHTAVCSVA